MGDSDLIAFIQKSRGKKRTDEQIRTSLISVGWKSEKIDAAFSQIDGQMLTAAQKSDGMDYMPQNVQAAQKKEDARLASQTAQAASQAKQGGQQPQQPASSPAKTAQQPALQSKPASAPPEQKPTPMPPTIRPPVFPAKPAAAAPASPPVSSSAKPAQASSQPPQTAPAAQAQAAPAQSEQTAGKTLSAVEPRPVSNPSFAAISGGFPAIKGGLPIAAIAIVLVILAAAIYISTSPRAPPSIQHIQSNNSSSPALNNSTAPQPSPSPSPVPNPPEPAASQNATAPPAPNVSQPYLPSLPDGTQLPPSGQPAESPATNTTPQPEPPPVQPVPAPAPNALPPDLQQSPPPAPSAANNSSQANQTGGANQSLPDISSQYRQVFRRSNSLGYTASSFCVENELGNFIQLRYDMYYGNTCSLVKPGTTGFANLSTFEADNCETVPCCVKGAADSFSKKYDEIDCGR